MEEIREFIEGLTELEYELVSIEKKDREPMLIELENVMEEIEKMGVKEIEDTYLEGIDFIDKNNIMVGLYAVC